MSESWEEEIGRDEHADLHVDRQHLKQSNKFTQRRIKRYLYEAQEHRVMSVRHLAGAGDVIDEDDELHPALPLVRLIAVQHRRLCTHTAWRHITMVTHHQSTVLYKSLCCRDFGNRCLRILRFSLTRFRRSWSRREVHKSGSPRSTCVYSWIDTTCQSFACTYIRLKVKVCVCINQLTCISCRTKNTPKTKMCIITKFTANPKHRKREFDEKTSLSYM